MDDLDISSEYTERVYGNPEPITELLDLINQIKHLKIKLSNSYQSPMHDTDDFNETTYEGEIEVLELEDELMNVYNNNTVVIEEWLDTNHTPEATDIAEAIEIIQV